MTVRRRLTAKLRSAVLLASTALLLADLLALAGCASTPSRPVQLPRAPAERVALVRPIVAQVAAQTGLPEALILGVIRVESSFNPRARSSAGACGLMQLMPQTARSLARRLGREDYDIFDPEFNVMAGSTYLALLVNKFEGDLRLALAGYNTGPYRVLRWAREGRALPAYSERYVAAVLTARESFLRDADSPPGGPRLDDRAGRRLAAREEGSPPRRAGTRRQAGAPETTQSPPHPALDQSGLTELLRRQRALYGDRPDEPVPDHLPALSETSTPLPEPEPATQEAIAPVPDHLPAVTH